MAWRIVIAGGGFGGLYAARTLDRILTAQAAGDVVAAEARFDREDGAEGAHRRPRPVHPRTAPEPSTGRLDWEDVTVADQVKTDLTQAMKAGERDRVGALRVVLSELQKAVKDGARDDEVTVLRRERKRRLDAAGQFRDAGRDELAAREESEAALIERYLPAELADAELDRIVAEKVAEAGAQAPRDMGKVMGLVMPVVGARADGKRVSAKVREALGA